ncbi:MAG: ABC transporter, partial [Clostridiales bacterium]|nr:ABC transporter [Clostridiales bacterium]
DRDWDTYRNHSVGFVFQSYNLIPHQSVLKNVELALTLSGVSKKERRQRAVEALEKVGLGDQIKKKPNQMSGGQMQRVAIARALVNNPEILLADEPTGALDSDTSVQVMELLKEIAADRLVIMVTHNPDLADQYASRIVRLLDGRVTGDTDPWDGTGETYGDEQEEKKRKEKQKKPSMSFLTALSLSLNNLMTKKGRTFLTAFAGSIGIIGIALILSVSHGVNNYIDRIQEDTLSSYPLQIDAASMDMSSMLQVFAGAREESAVARNDGRVHGNSVLTEMLANFRTQVSYNNLTAFKAFLQSRDLTSLVSDVKYGYNVPLYIYRDTPEWGFVQTNPGAVFQNMGLGGDSGFGTIMSSSTEMMTSMNGSATMDVWTELMDNDRLLHDQYDIVSGRMPVRYDEAVIIISKNSEISDYTLYSLGLRDPKEPMTIMMQAATGQEVTADTDVSFSYEDLTDLTFVCVPEALTYEQDPATGVWVKHEASRDTPGAFEIRIVGIIRPSENAVANSTAMRGGIGYLTTLTDRVIELTNASPVVQAQYADPDTDVLTGLPFRTPANLSTEGMLDTSSLPEIGQEMAQYFTPEMSASLAPLQGDRVYSSSTQADVLKQLGVSSKESPSVIYIYPVSFEAKDTIADLIDEYNAGVSETDAIQYTDYVGLLMSSITTIINAISYVLIAFVAISLVVSSIMIGIITYISVLERTKEIGILRAMGASKRDISRVFNAETLIVGFGAGVIGIGVTLLLVLLVNIILYSLTSISGLAKLPMDGAVILIIISMLLTFIAGLIPSRIAAKKDPVVALRSE